MIYVSNGSTSSTPTADPRIEDVYSVGILVCQWPAVGDQVRRGVSVLTKVAPS